VISALIIVFREMLEMALVLGVLLAATKGMPGTRRWIGMGALAGAGGAVLIALFMDELENSATGDGEFLFNAGVLMLASVLIAWTVIWMSQHGREMAARMHHVGRSVAEGELPKTALAIVSLTAVMREGGEAVFFLFGAAQSVHDDGYAVLSGGLLGVLSGTLVGYVIYKGMIHIPLKHLFGVIGWVLIFLAAGMASQAAQNLVLIDVLPSLVDPIWDSSAWLPQSSFIGEILHVMVGYNDQPSAMQMLIFLVTLVVIASLNRYVQRRSARQSAHAPA
jgi:high-affinity iron transporter